MKKMLCSLLTVLLLVSCFAGTVNAAERAMGKFDVTVKAGELKPAKGKRLQLMQRILQAQQT